MLEQRESGRLLRKEAGYKEEEISMEKAWTMKIVKERCSMMDM